MTLLAEEWMGGGFIKGGRRLWLVGRVIGCEPGGGGSGCRGSRAGRVRGLGRVLGIDLLVQGVEAPRMNRK